MSDNAPPQFDLNELMDEYGLGTVRNVCKAKGGQVNENWIVHTTIETVVVRGVSREHPRSDMQFEQSFIRALGRNGFPYRLPQPLRTRTGRTLVMKNGMYVWLYVYIEGSSLQLPQEEVIAQIAHAMATEHNVARRISLRQVKKSPIALEDLELVHRLRHWQLTLADSLDERCSFFRARVQECIGILEQLRCTSYHALPHFPIHGDMCLANVVFSGGRLTGIIDFDHCCSDTAIRDITTTLRYECADQEDCFKLDLEAARHFLRVYHKINPLSREEIDLIPAIAMAESADLFWWTIFQLAGKRTKAASMYTIEHPFKALQWYNRHQEEVAQALRV
jgi:homoserine kinase type II